MIEFYACPELSKSLRHNLEQEVDRAFGHVAFVQQHQWASPEFAAVLFEDKQPASFCFLLKQKVLMDNKWYWIAGIHNLITPPAFRGKGYAQKLMAEVQTYLFHTLQADFGLLLCADKLVPFYKKLGWYRATGSVSYQQPQGIIAYDSNTLLLAPEGAAPFQPAAIDLNGLPW